MGIKISELTEVLSVDTGQDYVMIQRGSDNKKIKAANLAGSSNVAERYIDLKSFDNGKDYRMILNDDGSQQIFPLEAFTCDPFAEGDNLLEPIKDPAYVGESQKSLTTANNTCLVINQMYGGGNMEPTSTEQAGAVSHSFVELYNNSLHDINLKGLYLHYRGNDDSTWHTLPLRGQIPSKHSFLIRGKQHGDLSSALVRCKITKYDQQWMLGNEPMAFSRNGMSMFLSISPEAPTNNPTRYTMTTNMDGSTTITAIDKFYIDLLGAGGSDTTFNPVAYEKFYRQCMDKNVAVRRQDFYNNTNNVYDTEAINYKTCVVDKYKPKSLADGAWDMFGNKIQLNPNIPNLVVIGFGEEGDQSRTFTWQSLQSDEGYLKYRRVKDANGDEVNERWVKVESQKEIIDHVDCTVTIHRVILHDLDFGVYEYQAGEEGKWSDVADFEIADFSNRDIKILVTTDEQDPTEYGYVAWKACVDAIVDHEYKDGVPNFDFHMDLGDISQNANRPHEWRSWFKYTRETTRNMPLVVTCGNNDLIDKKFGDAYNYYFTLENSPRLNDYPGIQANSNREMVSTCSWDLGPVHFININSNQEQMYVDNGVDPTEFLNKQAYFLDRDLWKVSQRAVKPKWVVVYAHLSPFSVTRAKRLQHWIPILEHYGVDAFICGHNHTYQRSIPIKCGYNGSTKESNYNTYVPTTGKNFTVNQELKKDGTEITRSPQPANGTYYLLYQCSGVKYKGKEAAINMDNIKLLGSDGLEITSAAGNEFNKHRMYDESTKTYQNAPWWYAYNGLRPAQPCYGMITANQNELKFDMYYVQNCLQPDKETGITNIAEYDGITVKRCDEPFDTLTIRYSDRRNVGYRDGVSAPFYGDENKGN